MAQKLWYHLNHEVCDHLAFRDISLRPLSIVNSWKKSMFPLKQLFTANNSHDDPHTSYSKKHHRQAIIQYINHISSVSQIMLLFNKRVRWGKFLQSRAITSSYISTFSWFPTAVIVFTEHPFNLTTSKQSDKMRSWLQLFKASQFSVIFNGNSVETNSSVVCLENSHSDCRAVKCH